jgi:hypothetical protein
MIYINLKLIKDVFIVMCRVVFVVGTFVFFLYVVEAF